MSKIAPDHLARAAFVYVRQSEPHHHQRAPDQSRVDARFHETE